VKKIPVAYSPSGGSVALASSLKETTKHERWAEHSYIVRKKSWRTPSILCVRCISEQLCVLGSLALNLQTKYFIRLSQREILFTEIGAFISFMLLQKWQSGIRHKNPYFLKQALPSTYCSCACQKSSKPGQPWPCMMKSRLGWKGFHGTQGLVITPENGVFSVQSVVLWTDPAPNPWTSFGLSLAHKIRSLQDWF
jgi:hypothetical protein